MATRPVARAERASGVLFGEDISTLPADDVLSVFDDVPSSTVTADKLAGEGVGVVDLLASSGLAASRGEGHATDSRGRSVRE
jgi:tyrosyl-tRNA synthetase